MKKEAEEWKLHRMAKVPDVLEIWQGSQNLRATQKGSSAQIKQMTAIEYISDTEEIVKASWSLFVTARRNKMHDRLHSLGNPRRCAGIRDIHYRKAGTKVLERCKEFGVVWE